MYQSRLINKEEAEIFQRILPPGFAESIKKNRDYFAKNVIDKIEKYLQEKNSSELRFYALIIRFYALNYTFYFTKEEVEQLAKLIYQLILDPEICNPCQNFLLHFLSIFDDFDNLDLVFEWRPLYELLYSQAFSNSKRPSQHFTPLYLDSILQFISKIKKYFPPNATEEILEEFSHVWDPKNILFPDALSLVSIFLPVNAGKHNLWFEDLISKYALYHSFKADFTFITLFSKLSQYPYQDLDWSPHIPLFFHKLALLLQIPAITIDTEVVYKEDSIFTPFTTECVYPREIPFSYLCEIFCDLFVNLLSTSAKDAIKDNLAKIVLLITPIHAPIPQNQNDQAVAKVVIFLDILTYRYSNRIINSRNNREYLTPLTYEDHKWYISLVLPLYILDLYAVFLCESLNKFVQILPSDIIPLIFDTIQRLLEYPDLNKQVLRTMCSIAPIVISSKEMLEPFKNIMITFVNDITASEITSTSWILRLYHTFAAYSPIDESLNDWVCSVVRQCANFAVLAQGDDYKNCLAFISNTLELIASAVQPATYKGMIEIVENKINEIPIKNLKYIIFPLKPISFARWCFHEINHRNTVILSCIIKSNQSFVETHYEKIINFIKKAMIKTTKDVTKQTASLIKVLLSTLLETKPLLSAVPGIQKISDNTVKWQCPTNNSVNLAINLINKITPLIKDIFAKSKSNHHKRIAIRYICACVKGLSKAASLYDYEFCENESFEYPKVPTFTFKAASEKLDELVDWLIDISLNHNLHHKALSDIITAFTICVNPETGFCSAFKLYDCTKEEMQLNIMYPTLDSFNSISLNGYAYMFYKLWKSSLYSPFTKFSKKIFDCSLQFILSPFSSVADSLATLFIRISNPSHQNFMDLAHTVFKLFSENYETAPNNSLTCFSNIIFALFQNTTYTNFDLLFDICLIALKYSPSDLSENPLTNLRSLILSIFEKLDFYSYPNNTQEIYDKRILVIKEMIKQMKIRLNPQDSQIFALRLISILILGNPPIFDKEITEFLIKSFLDASNDTIYVILPSFTSIVQFLIPRIPAKKKEKYQYETHDFQNDNNNKEEILESSSQKFESKLDNIIFEKVDEFNYDDFDFNDISLKFQKKHRSITITRDQSIDQTLLSNYFSDHIDKRIQISKVIYKYFLEDKEFLKQLIKHFFALQNHNHETYSFQRYFFWAAISVFLGPQFCIKILKECMDASLEDFGQLLIVLEIFTGILNAMKAFSYSQIKEVQPFLFNVLESKIIYQEADTYFYWPITIKKSIEDLDRRRYFWLLDFLLTLKFDNSPNGCRQLGYTTSLIVFLIGSNKELLNKVFPSYIDPLFSSKILKLDSHRNSAIIFLEQIFSSILTPEWIDEKNTFFNDYILPSDDRFIRRLLMVVYKYRHFASINLSPFCIDHIEEWTKSITEDKDEEEQMLGEEALLLFIKSDIISSISTYPLTKDSVSPIIHRVLEQLTTINKTWPVQVTVFPQIMHFLAVSYFFIDEPLVEKIILDIVIPGLLHPNSNVQDEAGFLLQFIFESFVSIKSKIEEYHSIFSTMLHDDNFTQRIAGAKGLFAIAWSTLIFDDVPQYILEIFQELQDCADRDSSMSNCINEFFNGFWSKHEENFTSNTAILLSPYKLSLKTSYIS